MRLLGSMVTKDEADRHLARSLRSLSSVCDDTIVFDDQSDDDTVDMARTLGACVGVRADDEPSFVQHEGQFRNVAWRYMEAVLKPQPGDWILSLDADEIIVAPDQVVPRVAVIGAVAAAKWGAEALTVRIHELWSLEPPLERLDGYWGTITGTRLFRWSPGRTIADRPMGSGSVPLNCTKQPTDLFSIAHLGYVRAEDREAKHARYVGRRGHNAAHVESILRPPTLQPLPVGLP